MAIHIRAACFTPFRACFFEDLIQAFLLGLFLHFLRAGHDHHARTLRNLAPFQHGGGEAQIRDARVGAGTDEDHIHFLTEQGLPGLKSHVSHRFFEGGFLGRLH